MRRIFAGRLIASVLLYCLAASAQAASFDCAVKPLGPYEQAICGDQDLSAADSKMAMLYRRILASLPEAGKQPMRDGQRNWLRLIRNACPIKDDRLTSEEKTEDRHGPNPLRRLQNCLKAPYAHRFDALNAMVIRIDGLTFLRIEAYGEVQSDNEEVGGFADLGDLGLAHYKRQMWPRLIAPAAAQNQKWNAWIKDAADSMDNVDDPTSNDILDFTIYTAQLPIIGVELIQSAEGLAHPYAYSEAYNFLLAEGRPVRISDVFANRSNWKGYLLRKMEDSILERRDPDDDRAALEQDRKRCEQDDGCDPKEIEKVISDPHRWRLKPSGFEIISEPEEFGDAYTDGFHTLTIPWRDLRPYLSPQTPLRFPGMFPSDKPLH